MHESGCPCPGCSEWAREHRAETHDRTISDREMALLKVAAKYRHFWVTPERKTDAEALEQKGLIRITGDEVGRGVLTAAGREALK